MQGNPPELQLPAVRVVPVGADRAGVRDRRRGQGRVPLSIGAARARLVLGQAGGLCFDLEVQPAEGMVVVGSCRAGLQGERRCKKGAWLLRAIFFPR